MTRTIRRGAWLVGLAAVWSTAACGQIEDGAAPGPSGTGKAEVVANARGTLEIDNLKLAIAGTSTVGHDFTCEYAAKASSSLLFDVENDEESWKAVSRQAVKIPVAEIRCPKDRARDQKTMEEKLRDALKMEDYPQISIAPSYASGLSSGDTVTATLRITMGGKTKTYKGFVLTKSAVEAQRFTAKGSLEIKMKEDFGLAPPTALMGLIKVKQELTVTVTFDAAVTLETLEEPDAPATDAGPRN